MSDPIDIPLGDDADHIVDPPIIDFLYFDSARDAYVITFVPDDIISDNEKEIVVVPRDSEDGRRIRVRLSELSALFGGPVDRVFHRGGGNFGFYLVNDALVELDDQHGTPSRSMEAYIQLQDLGMIAQIAFREGQLLKSHHE